MTALELHAMFTDEGVAPDGHFCVAPDNWRRALERLSDYMTTREEACFEAGREDGEKTRE